MNAANLREMNVAALLPKYINDSLLCFTLVHYEVEGGPDIATCNTNGFMYEIKNKTVLRCLNLQDNANSMSCYYLTENEKLVIFYVVLTSSNKLLTIRKTNRQLKVVEAYEEVKEFQVFDFECLGFPQIKITFIDDYGNNIYKFPVLGNVEADCNKNASTMAESLAEELQILNRHIDDLSEEYNQLRKICGFESSPADFRGISLGSITFSTPLDKIDEQKLMVCDKWQRVCGNNLVLGLRLHNISSQITLNDMEVIIKGKGVKDYSYSFFPQLHDVHRFLFAPRKVSTTVKPGERISAVGAVEIPTFFTDSEFSVSFYVTSSDLKEPLVKEIFEVNVLDIASRSIVGLEERFTVEDLMAVMTVKSGTRFKIETEDMEDDSVESLLTKNLGFTKIKHLKDKLFYCTSTYLNEVFVGLRHVSANPAVWTMLVYVSNSSQVFFLINALYDLLPDNTAILCEENEE